MAEQRGPDSFSPRPDDGRAQAPAGPRPRFGPGSGSGGPGGGTGGPGGRGGDREARPRRGGGGRYPARKKVCAFCIDNVGEVDYKDIARIRRHMSDRGKIEARRKQGTCAKHQRSLTVAIKRARHLALLPFVSQG